MTRREFCSDVSREHDEPLTATASRIDHWLLVEYRSLWAAKAFAGSTLTEPVKESLRAQVRARPNTRLLFIRRPQRRARSGLLAFAATSTPGEERVTRIEFDAHEDLAELDLATAGRPFEQPLFLVCTHGKHDRCCARHGRPLFEALSEEVDETCVWQCTHVGGDRFAANLVALPHGLYYGRVDRADGVRILDEHLAGRIALERYRGRSCYSFAVQAAERAVRAETGLLGLDDLGLHGVDSGNGSWRVVFEARRGERYEVDVRSEQGELMFLTCTAEVVRRPMRFAVSLGR